MNKQKGWRVTYEIITEESATDGDVAEHGFVTSGGWHIDLDNYLADTEGQAQGLYEFSCLREALNYVTPQEDSGRWFSQVDDDINYRTGEHECRSLHPPDNITPSSYARVKRALKLR